MLATFDFLKVHDDNGNEVDFSPQFTYGSISCVPVFLLHAPRALSSFGDRQTTQTLPVPNCPPDLSDCDQRIGDARCLISAC